MIAFRAQLAAAFLVVACSASPAQQPNGQTPLPVGAKIEASGYWTILTAPDSPPGPREPKRTYNDERTFYAQLAGVSNAEAAKRMQAQEKIRPEFERLMRRLRAAERGNYTAVELIHRPDWAYRIYFKRNPAGTLAKYTKNPRFQARSARYTSAELERMSKPWIDRLNSERLTTGYGMNARHGTADIDMVVSRAEFEAIARRPGWGTPPEFINLKFSDAPVGEAVDPRIARGIRIFAQSDRNLGATNQAALSGRIILRDGCLIVVGYDGKEQLAYFAREVGLGLDRSGYLSLHRRAVPGGHLGRIGEMFTWAGPNRRERADGRGAARALRPGAADARRRSRQQRNVQRPLRTAARASGDAAAATGQLARRAYRFGMLHEIAERAVERPEH